MQQEALEREKILSKRSSESTAESMLADIRVLKKSVLTAEMDRAATVCIILSFALAHFPPRLPTSILPQQSLASRSPHTICTQCRECT